MAEVRARCRTVGAFVLALAMALGPMQSARAATGAQPPQEESLERAKARLAEGTALYDQGKYEEALLAFQDAASLYASPDFQFNIGLCHERLGNYEAAVLAFRTYLRNKPNASDAASVEDRVRDLEERIELRKQAESQPPERQPEVKPPEESAPPPSPPSDEPVEDEPTSDERSGRGLVLSGAVMLGIGATGAAAGGVALGLLARSPSSEVDAVLNGGNPDELTLAETRDLAQRADRLRAGQIAALGAGGVLATAGLVMFLAGRKRRTVEPSARVRLLPTLTGAVVRGSF